MIGLHRIEQITMESIFMRLRQNYPISDRIKLLLILFFVLLIMLVLSSHKNSQERDLEKNSTIENLLQTAIQPMGSTMYIWGGGWDDEDTAAGGTSTQLGVSSKWSEFASLQNESYDFEKHRYERENGLDCSGYVGWVIYNTFETEPGNTGYVTTSTNMAESFAARGWGRLIRNPKQFLAGDVVSMDGHVWICLGACADGSVLLAHSSPPGVSVCGTQVREGEFSIAVQLAEEFMTDYYPNWQEMYPNRAVSGSYLENVSVFRWSENTMLDAEKMQTMSGEEIIVSISPNI